MAIKDPITVLSLISNYLAEFKLNEKKKWLDFQCKHNDGWDIHNSTCDLPYCITGRKYKLRGTVFT